MDQIELFNIRIHNVDMSEAVERIRAWAIAKKRAFVVTPNVDHVVKLRSDPEFLEIYRKADLVLADGMPLVWVSKLAGKPLKEKVSGSDLFLELCEDAEKNGLSIFLLGSASKEIVEATAARLKEKHPGLKIAGAYSPSFGFEKRPEENEAIENMINAAKPDMLFVGVGAPKQEKWISAHGSRIEAGVALGVGASFDFVAGSVKRAPVWMQRSGLEWLFRVIMEPKRMFKRYFIDDFAFFGMTLKELAKSRKKPPRKKPPR
jgi:exopolysaccharide biosynthesis WecB/TagA/CpsF family protein